MPSLARLGGLLLLASLCSATAAPEHRTNLVAAVLTEDTDQQLALIKKLSDAGDPLIAQALSAWRQGGLYLYETNETRTPFLLDAQADAEGKVKGIRVLDGELIKDGKEQPLIFAPSDLTAVDTTSKLRKALKTTLDLFALANPNPKMRRDAVTKLGQEQNSDSAIRSPS